MCVCLLESNQLAHKVTLNLTRAVILYCAVLRQFNLGFILVCYFLRRSGFRFVRSSPVSWTMADPPSPSHITSSASRGLHCAATGVFISEVILENAQLTYLQLALYW